MWLFNTYLELLYDIKDKISVQELYKATLEISDIKSDVASSMTDYYLKEIFNILQQTFIDDDEKCAELATLEWMCRNVLEWEHMKCMQTIRERQIERAKKFVESPSKLTKNRANDPKRFIEQGHCTPDGEIASKTITSLNQKQIDNEAKYDGLYAVCTNLEYDVSSIIKINQKKWEIEECFRIMKTEFKARPVYLSRKDRITAHFTTCFTALVIYRILEQKLNEKYTCEELIDTIRSMDMLIAPGEGYIPTYTRTDITDALHDAFGFRTDYQITSQKNMRKILNQTKKK